MAQKELGRVTIRSAHGTYISAQQDGSVRCDRREAKEWEEFTLIQVGHHHDKVALRSAHNTYLCADNGDTMVCNRQQVGAWETFKMHTSGYHVHFKTGHGSYMSGRQDGSLNHEARRVQDWEKFTLTYIANHGHQQQTRGPIGQPMGGQQSFFQTHHGKYIRIHPDMRVDGESGNMQEWERITIQQMPNGRVALRSHHGTYVSGRDNGSVTAVTQCQEWETWQQMFSPDGRHGFMSFHGKYLSVDQGGGVTASKTQFMDWEKFRITGGSQPAYQPAAQQPYIPQQQGGQQSFFQTAHGKFIRVHPDNRVDGESGNMQEWERITIQQMPNGRVTLRSHHGSYLSGRDNGSVTAVTQCAEWETWQQIFSPDNSGRHGFMSFHGKYLSVDQSGSVTANKTQFMDWEKFRITGSQPAAQQPYAPAAQQPYMPQQPYAPAPQQQPYMPQQPYAPAPQQQPYAPQQQPYGVNQMTNQMGQMGMTPMPGGSWMQSARNQRMQGNVLMCELNNGRGQFMQASVIVYPGQRFKNVYGQFQPE